MNRIGYRLLTLFNIRPEEGRLVALVLLYAIILYISNVLARTASYALFLTEFNASNLPYAYVGIAIMATLVSAVLLRLNNRLPLGQVLVGIHIFLILTLVGYWLGVQFVPSSWLLFTLPIYFGVNNSLTISSFWNLLGRVYNLQQGKRLFGLLSSGEHIATIGTGLLAPALVAWMGTANLFMMAALVMIGAAALLSFIIRTNRAAMSEPAEEEGRESEQSTESLFKDGYVLRIVSLFALFIIGVYFVDNIFYSRAELRYPDEDLLASFIGQFFGIMGGLSLFVQTFIAGRALTRFGVRAMILATPAGLLIMAIAFAALGTIDAQSIALFWLIAAANMYRLILDAVDSAAVNVLYQPLPARKRTQAQTTVIGIVYPLSIGFTGLAILFFTGLIGFDSIQLAYVLLIVLVAWLLTGLGLGRAYPIRLRRALHQRVLGGISLPQPDRSSLVIFEAGLSDSHPGTVIYALDILADIAPETMGDHLVRLLGHPAPEVRQVAAHRIEHSRLIKAIPALRQGLETESSAGVQAAALRALAALETEENAQALYPYLDSSETLSRQSVLVGLLENRAPEVALKAERQLISLATSTDADERVLAATVLGQAPKASLEQILVQLLEDVSPQVRRAALTSAGEAHFPTSWPLVAAGLASPETRRVAAAALIAGGQDSLLAIRTALARAKHDAEMASWLVRVCGRISGPDAIAILTDQFAYPAANVRAQVVAALVQCGYQVAGSEQTDIRALVERETAAAAAVLAAQVDLEPVLQKNASGPATGLLARALEQRLAQHQDNIFGLLSFIFPATTIQMAWTILQPGSICSVEQRAYALELIDITLDTELKGYVEPLLNEALPEDQLAQLQVSFPQPALDPVRRIRNLLALKAVRDDIWLPVCAIHAASRLELVDASLKEAITAIRQVEPGHPLLEETTAEALVEIAEGREPGGKQALSTVEKIIALKNAPIFAEAPDWTLMDLAPTLMEVRVSPGETIIRKGDEGDCMYIVVDGRVRIHDGATFFNYQEAGDAFGEMALLLPDPRSASVTAEIETRLLRLDKTAFYELLEDRIDVARGVIRVLSDHLRLSMRTLHDLQDDLTIMSPHTPTQRMSELEGQTENVLSVIEKVLILKGVDIFSGTPDDVLVDVAAILVEVTIPAAGKIIEKGDSGDCMYIITSGEVRVHEGSLTLNILTNGDVFGEMALLESEPRSASVTAVEDSRLLRLDQTPFYELMEDRPEVVRGGIRVLAGHLKARTADITNLSLSQI